MHLGFRKKRAGEIEFGLIYGTIGLIAVLIARVLPSEGVLPACLFKGLLHVPCPTCGTTRALRALGQGDLATALAWNPLAAAAVLASLLLLAANAMMLVFHLKRPVLVLTAGEGKAVRLGAAAGILLNWIFIAFSGR